MTEHHRDPRFRRLVKQQLESLAAAGVRTLPRPPACTLPHQAEGDPQPSVHETEAEIRPGIEGSTAGPPGAARPSAAPSPAREEAMNRRSTARSQSRTASKAASSPPDGGSAEAGAAFERPLSDMPALSTEEAARELKSLSEKVARCTRCPALVKSRTQTVFGVGNVRPRLCFFGEAPGAEEDRRGEPFVGRAGQLLNKIIAAMGLSRSDVYILNVLKCRPPENRDPLPEEVANCRPFRERQLEILRPEFICCLGRPAMMSLLDTKQSLGRMRGQWHSYRGAKVIVTYHPAYLLRYPDVKKKTWEDIQMLMREMGLKPPEK